MRILSAVLSIAFVSSVAFADEALTYQTNPKAPIHKTGLKMPKNWQRNVKFVKQPILKTGLPAVFDWRKVGISPAEDQGNCGSCWAFSITATFQDALALTEKKPINLSEQYLISCNTLKYNCEDGGFFDATDTYVNPGAVLSADYPYTATTGTCKSGLKYPYQEKSWAYVGNQAPDDGYKIPSDTDLKTAIYLHGPISVAVNATSAMQFYFGGVFNSCVTTTDKDINHAVNLVGWDDTKGAWIMRNSWGTSWGDKGFGYIKYGCNMLGYAANYIEYKDIPAAKRKSATK